MIAIEHAHIVLEQGILWNGVLLVEDDRIVAVGRSEDIKIPEGAERMDAEGAYVGPGFVDIHVHGGNGHFLYAEPELAAEHFLRHGETTVLATLYYDLSKQEFLEAIERVKHAMQHGRAAKAIGGFYMEGPYMNPKYGACPDKNKWLGPILAEDYTEMVEQAGDLAKVWAVAPERQGLEPFMRKAKEGNPKVMFSVGHSEATPEQIKSLKKYGIGLQTHCMNATGRPKCTEGTRSCGPDEACLQDRDMYAEVICDSCGIHVQPDMLRMILQVKGVDRMVLITDSFVSAEKSPEHLRHIEDLVFDSNGFLNGSKLTMDVACRNIMSHTNCGIAQAFLMASLNPARVIGMEQEIGSIEAGKKANLVFVDHMFHVKKVMFEGKMLDA
ncbi:MAG: amidohydrolase family protein [Lachnospiraceae bacterium]|nr:amidohydrolase family protein [Lachnospiraceae bacterium]